MDREIKFRAWDKNRKEMFIVDELSYTVEGSRTLLASQKDLSSQNAIFNQMIIRSGQYPIMQYIGLRDKNGKEIYEGDIVKCKQPSVRIVEWSNVMSKFCLRFPGSKFSNYGIGESPKFTEHFAVIGNIYANPELIK